MEQLQPHAADGGEPYYEGQEGQAEDYGDGIPDLLLLSFYCAQAHPPQEDTEAAKVASDKSWDAARQWNSSHSIDELREALESRDEAGKGPLHWGCQNNVPLDILETFLSASVEICSSVDNFGWIPLHYASAYGGDLEVMKTLVQVYPESVIQTDRKGRTPLHFLLGSNESSPEAVLLLSNSGAARVLDSNQMIALSYATAYGASEEVLYVLIDQFPDAINSKDARGRTPLSFALSNAGRKAAPAAVRLLLSLNPDLVNSIDGGPLPLRVLSEYASTIKDDEEQRESVESCLKHLLAAKPDPTADFFTALQSLPEFLQERAVVMRVVQELLNVKIAQRFPTAILLMDFYMQMVVVVFYTFAVEESINNGFPGGPAAVQISYLAWLYIGATYFLVREFIQIVSLISLKALHIWVYGPSNWLNVIYIALIYTWAGIMTTGSGSADAFRYGTAWSFGFIWIKFLAYLRNISIDFAVFTGGVFHVMRRLLAFLMCLMIILIAFSRMFFTLFYQTAYCNTGEEQTEEEVREDLVCERYEVDVWCHSWDSFLRVYTMLLGEVDETIFNNNTFAIILFVIFMLLVVILLANVLIAIVTDSYKIIQDQRAAIVFWTNRLDYVAQMDAIANGPWKSRLRRSFGMSDFDTSHNVEVTFGKDVWKALMDLFEYEPDEGVLSFEFLCYMVLRLCALVVIPLWVVLGALVAGWLWPPQVRKQLFTQVVSKHSSETEKEEELRKTQVQSLKVEIDALKDELMQELALDRTQVVQMKSSVAERKLEIQNEMKHIKRIVTMLFEQSGSG